MENVWRGNIIMQLLPKTLNKNNIIITVNMHHNYKYPQLALEAKLTKINMQISDYSMNNYN